jgi:HEPN domain-containing protein
MKSSNLDFAGMLARKAENDWKTAAAILDHGLPVDTACFHIQQAAEKLIKALLAWQGVDYPLTHNLKVLLELSIPHFPALAEFLDSLPDYTNYALSLQYDDYDEPDRDEAVTAFETAKRFRAMVHSLLPAEARP